MTDTTANNSGNECLHQYFIHFSDGLPMTFLLFSCLLVGNVRVVAQICSVTSDMGRIQNDVCAAKTKRKSKFYSSLLWVSMTLKRLEAASADQNGLTSFLFVLR